MVELQVHDDLPQVRPLGQIMHHKQASVEIIVKLAPADLPEGRLAHAMRQDVTARERAAFQRDIATQCFITAFPAHTTFLFAVVPVNQFLKLGRGSGREFQSAQSFFTDALGYAFS